MRAVILDGHNDLAFRVSQGRTQFQVDLAAAGDVGFAGGFFALGSFGSTLIEPPVPPPCALPLGGSGSRAQQARADVEGQLTRRSRGIDLTVIVRHADEIVPGQVNAIVHLEGAEPIAPDPSPISTTGIAVAFARSGSSGQHPPENAFGEGVPAPASHPRPTPARA